MGRYASKCKESGEAAVMEKPVDNTASSSAAAGGRKRKAALGESELSKSSIQLKTRRLSLTLSTPDNSASPARSLNSTCESVNSGRVLASSRCSSSRAISELAKEISCFVDLEVQQENEMSVEFFPTSAAENSVDIIRNRRETTPSSGDDVQSESGELESTARPRETNSGRRSAAAKMPTEAELEDFFTAAENNLQKQFIDKYNYDIVKDEPMEGRYEWVQIQLKP